MIEDIAQTLAIDGLQVKSICNNRYFVVSNGCIFNSSGKQLKPGLNSRGYLTVSLYDGSKPKKAKSFLVHRLVMEAFVGKSELQVNHKNGNKQDNVLENLEYCTSLENNHHAINVLKKDQQGVNNSRARLKIEDVREIKTAKKSVRELAEKFGFCEKHIADIRRGKYWKGIV